MCNATFADAARIDNVKECNGKGVHVSTCEDVHT